MNKELKQEVLDTLNKADRLISDMSRFESKMNLTNYALFKEVPIRIRRTIQKLNEEV